LGSRHVDASGDAAGGAASVATGRVPHAESRQRQAGTGVAAGAGEAGTALGLVCGRSVAGSAVVTGRGAQRRWA
jgi:lipid-binding SYLF domain-containing protein